MTGVNFIFIITTHCIAFVRKEDTKSGFFLKTRDFSYSMALPINCPITAFLFLEI